MPRFSTTLKGSGPTTTGIVVSDAVLAKLSSARRPAVTVTVNGYHYRTTVGIMGGVAMLPFSAEHRKASGLNAGDAIEVELALDTAPRTVDIPDDLRAALDARKALRAAFDNQAPSRRKADVDNVASAKSPETRARRIAAIVERLRG